MAIRKRVKQTASRRRQIRFSLDYDKTKWVISSLGIKKLRESFDNTVCPVSLEPFSSSGMKQAVLDHSHLDGKVRGVLAAGSNLFEGRCWKYFKKLFKDKSYEDYCEMLIRLGEYLKQEPIEILHGAIVQAEKKHVSRWRNETLYKKLLEKGVALEDLECYTRYQLVELWLNQFIKEKEATLNN